MKRLRRVETTVGQDTETRSPRSVLSDEFAHRRGQDTGPKILL